MPDRKRKLPDNDLQKGRSVKILRSHKYRAPPPAEIVEEIINHTLGFDREPREIARDLNSIAASQKFIRQAILGVSNNDSNAELEGGIKPVTRFIGRVKRLTLLSHKLFEAAALAERLPDRCSRDLGILGRRNEGTADGIIAAVTPILQLQKNKARKNLVRSLQDLGPEAATASRQALARSSFSLDIGSKNLLGADAIKCFSASHAEETRNSHTEETRNLSAEAIVHLENHGDLSINNTRRLNNALSTSPELTSALNDVRSRLATSTDANLSRQQKRGATKAETVPKNLDARIELLEGKLAAAEFMFRMQSELSMTGRMAAEIPKLLTAARTDLQRSRSGNSL